jgi:predicted DNA-binding protein (UPF0278 family)
MQSLRMHHNGFEVLDSDDDVHILLHMEVVEIIGVESDDGLERLFEHLLAVLNLLCETCKDHLAV